jgi:hypothetical protein
MIVNRLFLFLYMAVATDHGLLRESFYCYAPSKFQVPVQFQNLDIRRSLSFSLFPSPFADPICSTWTGVEIIANAYSLVTLSQWFSWSV